ncbi:transporter substrate-binding domain-containing protein [Micromonospora sp. NPDC004704]
MTPTSAPPTYRSLATSVAVLLTLALAAAAGCQSQQDPKLESVQEKLKQTHIYQQGKLRVGVAGTEPLMGEVENGVYKGFDIEIARYIASSLGYSAEDIEFKAVETENRIPRLQGGDVDLVVSSFSITEEREKLVSFAGPYFVTTQEVLIPVAMKGKIQTIEDLRNPAYRVCTSGGSTSEEELERHKVSPLVVMTTNDCVTGIRAGRYDAMSSDETILAGFMSRYPKEFEIVGMPFGTSERLGIGVPITDPALRDLVAYFLQKSYLAGRNGGSSPWRTAYNRTLGPWLGADRNQPAPEKVPDLIDFDERSPR